MKVNNQVFNDAPLIGEMSLRDNYQKVVEDRMLYMAICSALILRLGNEVILNQKELLLDATIYIKITDDQRGFMISVEGQRLIEEIDGQMELPLDE